MATLSVVAHRTTPNIYETPSERKGLRQVRGENCINLLLNTQVNYYPINNVWNIWLKIIMSKFVHFISSFVTYQLLIFISLVFYSLKAFCIGINVSLNCLIFKYWLQKRWILSYYILLVKGKKGLAFATLNNEHITSFHTGPLAPGCRSGWIHLSRRGHCSWPSMSAVSTQLSGLQSGYSQGSALTHTKCPLPALFCK